MAKQIKQFRYYYTGNSNNEPVGLTQSQLVSGAAFKSYFPVTQLGIQALPGTKFYLNNNTNSVIIGSTGIFELNLEGIAEIAALRFDINSVELIGENESAYIIVDIVYDAVEGG